MKRNSILQGDALAGLRTLPDESVDMCMTSPPYWALRDYGTDPLIWDGNPTCQHEWEHTRTRMHNGRGDCQKGAKYSEQEPIPDKRVSYASCVKCRAWKGSLGLEPTPELYTKHLCDIFDQVKRVLAPYGSCWVNLGDTYAGKSLCEIPDRFAIEMSNRGWVHRNKLVWHKTNAMPESCKDRFTRDFEEVHFFTKSPKHFFRQQLVVAKVGYRGTSFIPNSKHDRESKCRTAATSASRNNRTDEWINKRNMRCVWSIPTARCSQAHFATFPPALCEAPIDAGCPVGGVVLDPFFGSGTVGVVALKQGKDFVGIELNGDYVKIAEKRLAPHMPLRFDE
jgi:DNA modification methylase